MSPDEKSFNKDVNIYVFLACFH